MKRVLNFLVPVFRSVILKFNSEVLTSLRTQVLESAHFGREETTMIIGVPENHHALN